jgi:hypothetical protein
MTADNQVRLGNNDIQSLYCMGAYNSVTYTETHNLFISPDGQIMRVEIPPKKNISMKTRISSDLDPIEPHSSLKVQFDLASCDA